MCMPNTGYFERSSCYGVNFKLTATQEKNGIEEMSHDHIKVESAPFSYSNARAIIYTDGLTIVA